MVVIMNSDNNNEKADKSSSPISLVNEQKKWRNNYKQQCFFQSGNNTINNIAVFQKF